MICPLRSVGVQSCPDCDRRAKEKRGAVALLSKRMATLPKEGRLA
ncbi:hypothetical protein ANACOL_00170 [Anaerotruncus colihominis DSM 17241]|uniref:Uncharacterized protein n=1 Tax=Anaerotruncus colihominis DSM 17241 TaxID=445972 RepID=B0P5Z8_9FIRM|nr:hypothetical protein ANACOL_00170 [Anaerotruncus colihominis DSM 17241]